MDNPEIMNEMNIPQEPISRRKNVMFICCVLVIGICAILGFGIIVYFHSFLLAAHLRLDDVITMVRLGNEQKKDFTGKNIHFLLLGLDERSDSLEKTLLTDAIVYISLNTSSGKISVVPLPRDLWIDSLKTKINALYYYGTKSNTDVFDYMRSQIQGIVGQPVEYVFTINYNELPSLVDMLGGVDITIQKSFTDTKYPNPKYIESSVSGEPIYKTVSFTAGNERLNGERALEFVRSRQSTDIEEGTDLARSHRQEQLLSGLVSQMLSKKTLLSPTLLGSLYRFWEDRVGKTIQDRDIISLLLTLRTVKGFRLTYANLPIFPDDLNGVIVHPPINKHGQWVWEPVGGDFTLMQKYIHQAIK